MNNIEIRRMLKIKLDPMPIAKTDWYRAAGACLCECGHEYYLHPVDPFDLDYQGSAYMHVLCNGDRVKL